MKQTEERQQTQANEVESLPRKRTVAEWITFVVAVCILVALIGLVIYDWRIHQNSPPVLRVEQNSGVRVIEQQYYVPFVVCNRGGSMATSVEVVASLHLLDHEETGTQQINFLAGGEKKFGSFVFSHDPRQGELLLRIASYQLP